MSPRARIFLSICVNLTTVNTTIGINYCLSKTYETGVHPQGNLAVFWFTLRLPEANALKCLLDKKWRVITVVKCRCVNNLTPEIHLAQIHSTAY